MRVAGTIAEAQPKALDLLLYLITHRDRVIDKDELLEQIWPRVVVSESALTQALRKARAMVGDDGERQAVIRTVQRRGFRFVAELRQDLPPVPTDPPASAPAKARAVAVLPFADMSPQRDQEYFCDGMAEEIINALTRAGQRVAARTSSFAFKGRHDDVREIARSLNVTLVLEGSVRKAGDHLRVTAQLVDALTGFHLWSESWDRRLEDMFAIQDEIARRIATTLGGSGRAPAIQPGGPVDAGELSRRGRAYQHRFGQRAQRSRRQSPSVRTRSRRTITTGGLPRRWASSPGRPRCMKGRRRSSPMTTRHSCSPIRPTARWVSKSAASTPNGARWPLPNRRWRATRPTPAPWCSRQPD
ncbi:MAG: winged helix-turn-helix domain-containing protein [Gammaproteobacteria bacterium]|nr:winged helix-turn-helix domain-containing protein [Gammaproteobacteria bacterium]